MIAEVQTPATSDVGSTTSTALAYGSNITAGSLLVAAFRIGGDRTESVSDDVNGAWTKAAGIFLTGHGEVDIWYFPNAAAGATTVTVSFGGAAASVRLSIHEYSGVATTSPLEQANTGSGASGNPSGYGVTTTQANQLIFSACGTNTGLTVTAEASYTLRSQVPAAPNTRMASEHQIVSAAGTYNGTFSFSDTTQSWVAAIATFKEATAAPTVVGGNLSMMGVG